MDIDVRLTSQSGTGDAQGKLEIELRVRHDIDRDNHDIFKHYRPLLC